MNWNIICVEKTASTMADALAHTSGTVIVAAEQTAGQGRLGRRWHSAKGDGLYLSAVLPLPCPAAELPVVTLALGLAAHEAIQDLTGTACDLRWPNDVLIGEKKCAGILVELHGARVIAGIGVNVNHEAFPPELAAIATSLRLATGRPHSPDALLPPLLDAIAAYTGLLRDEGAPAILRLFERTSSYASGRRVIVENAEQSLAGTTDGLDASGFLWIRASGGRRHLVRAGGVRPCNVDFNS